MAVSFLGGDAALVDGVWTKVSSGDLVQFTVAQQIATRVADMDQRPSRLPANRIAVNVVPMPTEFGLGGIDVGGDGRVALVHRVVEFGQQIAAGLVVVEVGQGGDHELEATSPAACPPIRPARGQRAADRHRPSPRCWRAPGRGHRGRE